MFPLVVIKKSCNPVILLKLIDSISVALTFVSSPKSCLRGRDIVSQNTEQEMKPCQISVLNCFPLCYESVKGMGTNVTKPSYSNNGS